ncbi:MAG: hypothetical protein A2161_04050 [Candidatus Schekmanbacteria bacterium RBG_13_48_7]|uniref:Right handed beta helix domain-containing protein n=1 Tax=Candidatus Schekmanbacteria bacterium RBG_13_48_7 TaxID=1817878 RepID=A0A1F7RM70_9BACT|nr:MAG: hypothetical protein A2161_04050 [Candidatus Schekmanbacteria bacterium RBG_13_48_7]
MVIRGFFLIVISGILFFASHGYAIINVPGDYPTIQEAIDAAAPEEKVLVQPGIYNEYVQFYLNKRYVLEGVDRDTTIIDGDFTWTPVNILTQSSVSLSYLTIRNSASHGINIYAPDWTGSVTINNCVIMDNINDGIHYVGGYNYYDFHFYPYRQYCTIIDSIITNNSENGIYFDTVSTYTIKFCEITNNGLCGISTIGFFDGGVSFTAEISFNYFAYNSCGIHTYDNLLDLHASNNLFEYNRSCAIGGFCYVGCNFTMDDNTFQFNSGSYLIDFDSKYTAEFHLKNNSVLNNTLSTDICSFTSDMGAYIASVEKNFFSGNIAPGHLFYAIFCETMNFTNNIIFNNTVSDAISAGGFYPSELIITNNTLVNNSWTETFNIGAEGPIKIVNNIFSLNSNYGLNFPDGCMTHSLTPCDIKNNDIYGNFPADIFYNHVEYTDIDDFNLSVPEAEANISCDPSFKAADDFHLAPSSCCIDTGSPDSAPSFDIDNEPRPMLSGYDIGADEALFRVPTRSFVLLVLLPVLLIIKFAYKVQ